MSGTTVISISGKGGVGKTTVAALILKYLVSNDSRSILVVDADPATNLPDVLGVKVAKTVGMVTEELKKKISEDSIPSMISKENLLEAWIYEVLVESESFDLLAMGKSEGEGCYCAVNHMLTKIVDSLSKNYEVTLMDMEAGLEHLSRRTDRDVDVMLVVTDASKMGIQTAERIKDLTKEVHINFNRMYLIGNNIPSAAREILRRESDRIGLKLLGIIPSDPAVSEYNIEGRPLLKLPDDSAAFTAILKIMGELGYEEKIH